MEAKRPQNTKKWAKTSTLHLSSTIRQPSIYALSRRRVEDFSLICKNVTRIRARKDVTNAPPCRSWLLPLPMLFCHNVLLSSFSYCLLTTKLRLYFESCKKRKTKIIPTTQCEDDLLYIVIRCVFYFTTFLVVPSLILRIFSPF